MPAAELHKFGSDMLRCLLVHFCGSHLGSKRMFVVSGRESIIAAEFMALKNALIKTVNELQQTNAMYIWRKLSLEEAQLNFPNLFQLVLTMFLIPVQTAVVERGFSLHKIIKNKLRNRLEIVTVDSLMRVKLLCNDLEGFDVDVAAKKYVISPAGCMVLNQLHKKVSQIEIGRLEDGIDDGEPALMMAVMMMVMMMLYGLRMKKAVMKLRMNLFLLLIPTVWQLFKLKVKPHFWRTFVFTNVTRYCLLLLSPRPK